MEVVRAEVNQVAAPFHSRTSQTVTTYPDNLPTVSLQPRQREKGSHMYVCSLRADCKPGWQGQTTTTTTIGFAFGTIIPSGTDKCLAEEGIFRCAALTSRHRLLETKNSAALGRVEYPIHPQESRRLRGPPPSQRGFLPSDDVSRTIVIIRITDRRRCIYLS
jgi:hypothetical protein